MLYANVIQYIYYSFGIILFELFFLLMSHFSAVTIFLYCIDFM